MTTLHQEMEKHYVDEDGKVVVEAVELGHNILRFYAELMRAKSAIQAADPRQGVLIDDLALSLVSENFDMETLQENRHIINAQLAIIDGYSVEAGSIMREWVYSSVMDLLSNKVFQHETCKLPLHLFIMEGLMRMINAYVFSGIKEEEGYRDIAYANLQCSAHALAFIAFACNTDVRTYFSMNLAVEKYMYQISKVLKEA